ncbi:MAG: hypothetical protein NTY25_15535 [Planctomycetia bacterium]|nr:hypothetical protein [Planctomycetia bacterium]
MAELDCIVHGKLLEAQAGKTHDAVKLSIELSVPLLRSATAPVTVMKLSFADTIAVPLGGSVSEEPMKSNRSVPELAASCDLPPHE